MSARDYAILWVGATKGTPGGGAGAALGGNALLTVPQHKLDGIEHTTADDSTRLDATVDQHGLLPKLSGVSTEFLNGLGAFADPGGAVTLDDLTDVTITSPAAGQKLRFNGSVWVNVQTWHEPQFDYTGSAILDGAGNPIMVEVVS